MGRLHEGPGAHAGEVARPDECHNASKQFNEKPNPAQLVKTPCLVLRAPHASKVSHALFTASMQDDVLGLLSTSRHGHRSTMTDLAKPAQPKSRREMAKVDYDDSFERMLSAQELEELIQLKQATGESSGRLLAGCS